MKKKHLVLGIVALVAIAVIVLVYVLSGPKPTIDPTDTSGVGQTTTTTVAVEDIHKEEQTTTSTSVCFLEPNESEADRLLQEHQSRTTTTSTVSTTTKASTVTTAKQTTTARAEQTQSFEEDKKELENTASEYLKEHNIDPRTAGETGETCVHCGKKIWDPDKYGFFIPGMPADYENSGYCLGTCGITFG